MENVVILFGIVAILIVNVESWFKSVFKDICAALGIIYWPLARGNHKGMRVENITAFSKKRRQF